MYMTGWRCCEKKMVSGLVGRVRFDSARTSTSTWTDGPDSIRQREDEYWYPDRWAEFDWAAILRIPAERVRFVTRRSIDGLSWVEFDLSTRGALMVDHVPSLLRHAEVCRWWSWVEFGWQHRCFGGELSVFGLRTQMFWWWTVRIRFANLDVRWQLCAIYFELLPILWIYQLSCDNYRRLCAIHFGLLPILWIHQLTCDNYRHLCAIFYGLSSILWKH
jgi:hypothetical protein